jgi:hypothetical protein
LQPFVFWMHQGRPPRLSLQAWYDAMLCLPPLSSVAQRTDYALIRSPVSSSHAHSICCFLLPLLPSVCICFPRQ